LLGDLDHILERSDVGAEICFDALPAHPALEPLLAETWAQQCVLAGGDDYELCFTAEHAQHVAIKALEESLGLKLTRIGRITAETGLQLLDASGQPMQTTKGGYDHFA
jgi:thiamine-monophosphate kinase